jgi:hypothetical protein
VKRRNLPCEVSEKHKSADKIPPHQLAGNPVYILRGDFDTLSGYPESNRDYILRGVSPSQLRDFVAKTPAKHEAVHVSPPWIQKV